METQATNPAPGGSGLPTPGNNPKPADSAAVEAQRAKWREKHARKQARKLAAANQPAQLGGPPVAPVPPLPGQPQAPAPGAPPVPWTPDTLRPLFKTLVPALEKMDVNSLRKIAIDISPEAVQTVEKLGPWNEAVKLTLIESSSSCSAKWANKLGISAEYAPEVTLSIAVGTILGSHISISAELQKLAAEMKAERDKAAREAHKKALAHAPA